MLCMVYSRGFGVADGEIPTMVDMVDMDIRIMVDGVPMVEGSDKCEKELRLVRDLAHSLGQYLGRKSE